jgi:hypothetical protein
VTGEIGPRRFVTLSGRSRSRVVAPLPLDDDDDDDGGDGDDDDDEVRLPRRQFGCGCCRGRRSFGTEEKASETAGRRRRRLPTRRKPAARMLTIPHAQSATLDSSSHQ